MSHSSVQSDESHVILSIISFLGQMLHKILKIGNLFLEKIIFVERLSPKMEVIGIPVRKSRVCYISLFRLFRPYSKKFRP